MEETEKSMKSLNPIEESIPKITLENFNLELNDIIYSINISKNDNNEKILISAKNESENDVLQNLNYFENSFSLDELISKSKPFKLCDTIDDAFDIFIDILKAQKAFLDNKKNEEEENEVNNCILFGIKISLPGGKEQDVEFELNQKKLGKDEYIKELIHIIEKLHKENEDLKYENNLKDNEIKILKKKFGINIHTGNSFNSIKNKSFDSKINMLDPSYINTNYKDYKDFYKYGFNDMHNTTDIKNILNYDSFYNSNSINLNKLNPNDELQKFKSPNSATKFYHTNINYFKKGKSINNPNESIPMTYSKKTFDENNKNPLKVKENNNNIKKVNNGLNKSKKKNKKKEIELNNVIYIKNELSKMTMVPIDDYMSIKQIKMRYCAKKCIPVEGKELYYRGKKLKDEKSLEFYNIQWESTLYIFNSPNKINVFIRSLSGKEFKIEANDYENILQIKLKIYEFENIPIDKQIVLLNNKILDDEKIIRDLNVDGNVHLIVRKKGDE